MTNPIITIHDIETDEIITREMNAKELAQYKADSIASNKIKTEAEAKLAARAEILERLGLTADEAAILLG
jgi:membrane protein involved in colicin uptake